MEELSTVGWITVDEWCRKYQDNLNTVHKRVSYGQWLRGEHYSSPDGGMTYIHEEKAMRWLELRGKLML